MSDDDPDRFLFWFWIAFAALTGALLCALLLYYSGWLPKAFADDGAALKFYNGKVYVEAAPDVFLLDGKLVRIVTEEGP